MKKLSLFILTILWMRLVSAQELVLHHAEPGSFPIVSSAGATSIYVDSNDHWLVRQAAIFLQQDIQRVTGRRPEILHRMPSSSRYLIIIGSLDSGAVMKKITLQEKVLNDSVRGKWEAFALRVRLHPVKGIGQALLIAGSDRRGTAYGIFELSKQMGVSPWYWWADVPVPVQKEIYIRKDAWNYQRPAVKYRGFFINDEAPCLSGWTKEKFGGFNHVFYEKVFELLLRMKANYLWPAMWGNAFNDDDTLNPVIADRYGIVMGTSHHEPMLRAQQEWKRFGSGAWNYETNASVLDSFWRKGIEHMGSRESIVTVGMRGDGDMPMTEGSNIALLEKIVHRQRQIIEDVTGKASAATPQSWALYKEVQAYYDKGMRVPDDVTLLLCDDNWGNVRKLPALTDKPRSGGYGMYYHFDYVGDPRNYKWLNTNPLPRVWEQMHLTKQYGVDRIWIVNVGDIKPLELPIEFFLDYAWNPDKWPADSLDAYVRQWAERQFGRKYAFEIADILKKYTFYNGRRKPELLSPDTYSLLNYDEFQRVEADYRALAQETNFLEQRLPPSLRDAYEQLVAYPVEACANLNKLYFNVARNHLYASQGRSNTNFLAQLAQAAFERDSLLSAYYNNEMAGGKWRHMMDQTHIGYTYWQQPPFNKMPDVIRLPYLDGPTVPDSEWVRRDNGPAWGVAIEGSSSWWPQDTSEAVLPAFDRYGAQRHYLEFFSRMPGGFIDYDVKPGAPWLHDTGRAGRTWISVDWEKMPAGEHRLPIIVTGPDGRNLTVTAIIHDPSVYDKALPGMFMEGDGYVSMEAEHHSRAIGAVIAMPHATELKLQWQRIPGLGRTLSGMEAMPVTADAQTPGGNSPHLEYTMYLTDTGDLNVYAYFSPTQNFSGKTLRYAVSFDHEAPQIIPLAENSSGKSWEISVANNTFITSSVHHLSRPGMHVLKYWMVDPGVVVQKIVVDAGGMKQSYLGPPESLFKAR